MYAPVAKFPDFPQLEQKILALWERTGAFKQLKEQNRGKPKWSFLDGPITANNPMGVHHAWGRSLKDMYQRFHAMCGEDLRFQNGFDCQGLWVEVEVEKEHGFKHKHDIESYGIDRFVEDCKARVRKFSKVQTEQSIRLGYWMDWDDSYYTMADENNYTIWSFLEKCHSRGLIHRGFDSMPWCPRCGVGLSEMEMHEGYKWVEHLSVFARFPLRGRDKEALLVWTTTPWTLTSNVGAAVHPEMSYYKIKQGEWIYYAGAENWDSERSIEVERTRSAGKRRETVRLKTLAEHLAAHGEVEIVGSLKGEDMLGWEYDAPFDALEAQATPGGYPHQDPKLMDRAGTACHRVIAWDLVTGSEGTGIVHIAPGCGKEDFRLGKEQGLVAITPLDEGGNFLPAFGWLAGRDAQTVAEDIAADLEQREFLLAQERYPHRYAHCWRCATPILYRMVDEWFIDMSWRDEIIGTIGQIRWIPEYGEQRELDWLKNMGDWMISKKRYWGLALPIWQCEHHDEPDPEKRCDWFTVIGGREQLKQKAIAGWDEFEGHTPHRPFIDAVEIRCERCGGTARRITDVGNPWLDAGIVPYSTIGYNSKPDYWSQWFPPELVLECFPGQFRNWFYAMLAMNAMMQEDRWADRSQEGRSGVVPPFKTLLGHALVFDEQGREMHKSLGNAIEFNAAAETIGAEVMRYIFASQNPTTNLRFPDISEKRKKNKVHLDQEVKRTLLTLWNCYSFYVTYAAVDGVTPGDLDVSLDERSELDRWILSKFQGLVRYARECFAGYRIHLLMERFERFLDDLSNWYLRRSRRRFWKSESDTDKLAAYATLYEVLEGSCRLIAPILPFLAEEIYQNLVRSVVEDAPDSVHLLGYPEHDESRVDEELERGIDVVVRYKNLGLSLRNQANTKIRQPLSRLLVKPADAIEREALQTESLRAQLLEEINVKELELLDSTEGLVRKTVQPNFKVLGPKIGKQMKAVQAQLPAADAGAVEAAVRDGGAYRLELSDGMPVLLGAEDVEIRVTGPEGVAVIVDGEAFAGLETTISAELKREGIARDFVRVVQNERKNRDLEVTDRIRLRYKAQDEIAAAIEEWTGYIGRETLALEIGADEGLDDAAAAQAKVSGSPVLIAVEKAAGE